MKKAIIHILLLLVFIDGISLNELAKVPILFAHFLEHRDRDQNIDFISFLAIHYWGEDIDDNDTDRDNQLPFKKINSDQLQQPFIASSRAFDIKRTTGLISNSYTLFCDHYIPDPNLSSLYRPPRNIC